MSSSAIDSIRGLVGRTRAAQPHLRMSGVTPDDTSRSCWNARTAAGQGQRPRHHRCRVRCDHPGRTCRQEDALSVAITPFTVRTRRHLDAAMGDYLASVAARQDWQRGWQLRQQSLHGPGQPPCGLRGGEMPYFLLRGAATEASCDKCQEAFLSMALSRLDRAAAHRIRVSLRPEPSSDVDDHSR